ncbi:MAG: MBL fold metallo-hydrolase [Acidilobaceae archaeon]
MIEVSWCGHSYVVLNIVERGLTIAIDPHDGISVGLPSCRLEADIVLVTHDHYDHNAIDMARGSRSVVLKAVSGKKSISGVDIEGYLFYHDKSKGRLRGLTTAYCIRVDNIRICHLGDIGHIPEERQLEGLRDADALFVPVGGVYTIDGREAWELIQILKPRLVVPIHYWTPGSLLPLDPLNVFLDTAKTQRIRLESNKFRLPLEKSLEKTTIMIPRLSEPLR